MWPFAKTDESSSCMLSIGLRRQLGSNICRTMFILTAAWCSAHHFLPSCCSSGFLGSGPEALQLARGVDLWFCCSVSSAALATFYSLYLFSLKSSNSYTVCSSLQNWIFQHGINEQGFDLALGLCRPVYPPGVRYRVHNDFLTTLNCSILHTICCFFKKKKKHEHIEKDLFNLGHWLALISLLKGIPCEVTHFCPCEVWCHCWRPLLGQRQSMWKSRLSSH